jgi:hypothetical protein
VTTDDPFVVVPPDGVVPEWPYVVGISVKGTTKVVPLTRRVCLVVGDEGFGTTYVECSEREVRKVNEVLAANYDRFLFGPDKALVENLTRDGEISDVAGAGEGST